MTDILSETHGRNMIARTTFEKEAVWLPLLAVHQMNSPDPIIRGKTFTDCVIEGPALVALVQGVTFDSCNMGLATDPSSLFYKSQGSRLIGAIGMADCRFVRCRFVQVGFTGHHDAVDQMANELLAARARSEGVAR